MRYLITLVLILSTSVSSAAVEELPGDLIRVADNKVVSTVDANQVAATSDEDIADMLERLNSLEGKALKVKRVKSLKRQKSKASPAEQEAIDVQLEQILETIE